MSERSLQQLEKLMHKESEADARNVQNAQRRVKQAEKALHNAIKETEKAQKAVEKAAKQEIKTSKTLHGAEDKLKGAVASREQAEKKLADKDQRVDLEQQDIQQRYMQLDEAYSTFDKKERERLKQLQDMKPTNGHAASEDSVGIPTSSG